MKDKTLLVIPAYNEEFVMGKSLRLALECKRLGIVDDFILLNDRSDDRTAEVASECGADVRNSLFHRHGKGECFLTALAHCIRRRAAILAMLDADIVQATPRQVGDIVGMLVSNPNAKMAVHPVNEGYKSQEEHDISQKLSGARAIRVGAAMHLLLYKDFRKACRGFGLEIALNEWLSAKYGKEAVVFMPESRYSPLLMLKNMRRPDVYRREMHDMLRAMEIIKRRPKLIG
ncbi:MAG: glycosyltransferase [Candidatus Micrarchaeia archaeon]|jgi:glycosyltransferase involved in cell wall biosynthesis